MKKVIVVLFSIIIVLVVSILAANLFLNKNANYTNNLDSKKTVVVYYSNSNHTKYVANLISEYLKCDIKEITTNEYKNLNVLNLAKTVRKQMRSSYNPKINDIDISNYDVIFVGGPVWAGNLSLPVKSFLTDNDLSNKTIVPFYTFGGMTDKTKLDNKVKELSKSKRVLPSFLTVCYKFGFIEFRLTNWLNKINLD